MLTSFQLPLSILYLIQKYAVVLAELELAIVNVEVAEPPEQLPSDCESVSVLAIAQLTVALFMSLAVI